jgi:hypothetical protein
MRKFALLLASALIVSVPLVASAPTDSYAAAKKARAAKGGGESKEVDVGKANSRIFVALSILADDLAHPQWDKKSGKKRR